MGPHYENRNANQVFGAIRIAVSRMNAHDVNNCASSSEHRLFYLK